MSSSSSGNSNGKQQQQRIPVLAPADVQHAISLIQSAYAPSAATDLPQLQTLNRRCSRRSAPPQLGASLSHSSRKRTQISQGWIWRAGTITATRRAGGVGWCHARDGGLEEAMPLSRRSQEFGPTLVRPGLPGSMISVDAESLDVARCPAPLAHRMAPSCPALSLRSVLSPATRLDLHLCQDACRGGILYVFAATVLRSLSTVLVDCLSPFLPLYVQTCIACFALYRRGVEDMVILVNGVPRRGGGAGAQRATRVEERLSGAGVWWWLINAAAAGRGQGHDSAIKGGGRGEGLFLADTLLEIPTWQTQRHAPRPLQRTRIQSRRQDGDFLFWTPGFEILDFGIEGEGGRRGVDVPFPHPPPLPVLCETNSLFLIFYRHSTSERNGAWRAPDIGRRAPAGALGERQGVERCERSVRCPVREQRYRAAADDGVLNLTRALSGTWRGRRVWFSSRLSIPRTDASAEAAAPERGASRGFRTADCSALDAYGSTGALNRRLSLRPRVVALQWISARPESRHPDTETSQILVCRSTGLPLQH
ncbi:hypothetical protein DFH06DRAFT_1133707 [Mycena polygramma]|nr:hypothetical protein DFH06DRAFT_1133707 [Mycena polygramma]